MKKLLCSLLLLCSLGAQAAATKYYVATYGNDSNNGLATNAANAWLTWVHAAQTAATGDIIVGMPGTFTGTANRVFKTDVKTGQTFTNYAGASKTTILDVGSMASSWVLGSISNITVTGLIFSGENGNNPCFKVEDNPVGMMISNNVMRLSYRSFGFLLENASSASVGNYFVNNLVQSNGWKWPLVYGGGSSSASPPHAFYNAGGFNWTVADNEFAGDTNLWTVGNNSSALHCYSPIDNGPNGMIYERNQVHGFVIGALLFHPYYGATNWIRNNIYYNNRYTWQLGPSAAASNYRIMNNTDYGGDGQYYGFSAYAGRGTNNWFVNNISYAHPSPYPDVNIESGNAINSTNNLYLTKNGSWGSESGNVVGNPLFVDAANHDFTLATNSPALDTALTLTAFSNDYLQVARPQGPAWDKGALERSSGVTAPIVSVLASTPVATEANIVPGKFTISRAGSTTGALTINFTVTGTATTVTDYAAIGTTVVITNGLSSADILVTPVDDASPESTETVILTLAAGSYTIGSPSAATVSIVDNDTVQRGRSGAK